MVINIMLTPLGIVIANTDTVRELIFLLSLNTCIE